MARHTPVLEMKLIKWRYAKTVFFFGENDPKQINVANLGKFKRILISGTKSLLQANVLKWTQLGSITTKFDRCNC